MTAWLVDERWQKAYPIVETLAIGRGPENAVILRDPEVSRLHATVTGEENAFLLRSFGMSGTVVNGSAADGECILHEGDRIEIASSTLRFTRQSPDADMIVLSRDNPVSLDRIPAATSAHPVPVGASAAHRLGVPRSLGLALAFLAGSLLILLALK